MRVKLVKHLFARGIFFILFHRLISLTNMVYKCKIIVAQRNRILCILC